MPQQKIVLKSDNGAKVMRVLEVLTPVNDVVTPTVNADFLGQIYVNTAGTAAFIAVAVKSVVPANDWKQITNV